MMRDCRRDLVKLSEHRRLICRLNHCLVAGYDKCENRSQGCGKAHLEARPARDQPLLLQLQEYGVRRPGRICVAEPLKGVLTGRQRGMQLEARQRSVATGIGRDFLKRSEEHTSELQSQSNLVCRLLLEKKKEHTLSRVDLGDQERIAPRLGEVHLDGSEAHVAVGLLAQTVYVRTLVPPHCQRAIAHPCA